MKHHRTIVIFAMLLTGATVLVAQSPERAHTPPNVREELRMSAPLVTDQQVQHETLPQVAASSDSLVRVTTKYIRTYIDTIRVVRYSEDSIPRMDTVTVYADSASRKGHYLQAYLGGGYGSIGFHLNKDHGGKVTGFASGRIQMQYAWFFHEHWGIGAGLWFENLTSDASLANSKDYTDFYYEDRIDTDGEPHYNHTARIYAWKERSTLYNLAVPLSIQTQWWNESGEVGIFGALGIAPAFAVSSKYRLVEGEVEHFGEYPKWGLTLDGMSDHEYSHNIDPVTGKADGRYTDSITAQGAMNVRPMATLFGEVGVLINLNRQLDMMVGLYGHFTPNNVVTNTITSKFLPTDAGEDAPPFGWGEGKPVGPSTFMKDYSGLYATNLREGRTMPWAVGVKIGLHWHHFDKPKSHTEQHYDYFFRPDTTQRTVERIETESVERIDTLQRTKPKEEIVIIQKKVDKLNKIYFAFDSYTLNNKSKKYLRDIYQELKQIPNHIIIGGHSSEEGQAEYNERLALNRATAVKNYLVSLGLPEAQLEVKNYGARVANEERLDNNISLDRRVEIIIME